MRFLPFPPRLSCLPLTLHVLLVVRNQHRLKTIELPCSSMNDHTVHLHMMYGYFVVFSHLIFFVRWFFLIPLSPYDFFVLFNLLLHHMFAERNMSVCVCASKNKRHGKKIPRPRKEWEAWNKNHDESGFVTLRIFNVTLHMMNKVE